MSWFSSDKQYGSAPEPTVAGMQLSDLSGIATSSRPTIVEQDSRDDPGTDTIDELTVIIHLISEIRLAILPNIAHYRKIWDIGTPAFLLKRLAARCTSKDRSRRKLDRTSVLCFQALEQTSSLVGRLAYIFQDPGPSHSQSAVTLLPEYTLLLRNALGHLNAASTTDEKSDILDTMTAAVKRCNDSIMNIVQKDPVNEPSPLEAIAIKASLPTNQRRIPVPDFAAWALREADSVNVPDVGVVRSVHLFRERKAPLHHEFVIISLVGKSNPSWIRVERAARIKEKFIQADSFGPVLEGAPLREAVSFSSSKLALAGDDVDELAYVALDPSITTTQRRSDMQLQELAEYLKVISATQPLYRLTSANCRWFARRIVTSFARRWTTLRPGGFSIQWRGRPAVVKNLIGSVSLDPYGGAQLHEGQWVEARSQLEIGEGYLAKGLPEDALDICAQVQAAPGSLDVSLSATLYDLRARSLLAVRDVDGALSASQKACDMMQELLPQPSEVKEYYSNLLILAQILENLAYIHGASENPEKAVEAGQEAVKAWRELCTERVDRYDDRLAASLFKLAPLVKEMRSAEEALKMNQETVSILRELYSQKPDVYRSDLVFTMQYTCNRLNDLGRVEEGHLLGKEALGLVRELYDAQPDRHRNLLDVTLHTLRWQAADREQWEEAFEIGRQCVDLGRESAERNPDLIASRANLASDLHNQGCYAGHLKRWQDAMTATHESVEVRRETLRHHAFLDEERHLLSLTLLEHSFAANHLELWNDECNAARDAVEHSRVLISLQTTKERRRLLGKSLAMYAFCLEDAKRLPEVFPPAQEALRLFRTLYEEDCEDGTNRYNLVSILKGLDRCLRQIGRMEEADLYDKELKGIIGQEDI